MIMSQQLASLSYSGRTPDKAMHSRRGSQPYRVEWIGEPGAALASFEDLRAAIRYVSSLRLDQQHVVIYRNEVVWPHNVRRRVAAKQRGRVGMWRGGCRLNISVAAPFVWRCLSGSAVAPFPHSAHRTGQADLPHPALGQDLTPLCDVRRLLRILNPLWSL
jgi:hypothetical protein